MRKGGGMPCVWARRAAVQARQLRTGFCGELPRFLFVPRLSSPARRQCRRPEAEFGKG